MALLRRELLLSALLAAMLSVNTSAQTVDPLPADAEVGGLPIAQYATAWWQWAAAADRNTSPVADREGVHCGVNQRGPVWFLAGGWGVDRIIRYCDVPAGKHLFFPMINYIAAPGGNRKTTCEGVRGQVEMRNADRLGVWLRINGETIEGAGYVLSSPECFDLMERKRSKSKVRPQYPSATSGIWVMLPPLPPGDHTLEFGARDLREKDPNAGFLQDIEYVITISDAGPT
ncbi:MAG: hypothetical protein AAF229_04550 [Pseudomonadota bacterium]